jgi:glycosyltransferase involved in cell wall biosynthesis
LRRATDVIVPNDVIAGMIRGRIGGGRVHLVENSVDARYFDVRPGADPSRVLCVGRLLPLKAPQDLIEAARLRARDGRAIRVRFVGPFEDPWFFESLRERTRLAGVASLVEFCGFLSDDDLRREMECRIHPASRRRWP